MTLRLLFFMNGIETDSILFNVPYSPRIWIIEILFIGTIRFLI